MSIRRLVDLPAPFGPRNATSSPSPTSQVQPTNGLDRLLADLELPGQSFRVDHPGTSAAHGLSDRETLSTDYGHYLSAMWVACCIMANTSGRMLRLLSLLQTHRFWAGSELAARLGGERPDPATRRRSPAPSRLSRHRQPGRRGRVSTRSRCCAPSTPARRRRSRRHRGWAAPGGQWGGRRDRGDVGPCPDQDHRDDAAAPAGSDRCAGRLHGPGHLRWRPDRSTPRRSPSSPRPVGTTSGFGSSTRVGTASRATRLVEPNRLVTVGRRWYLVAWDVDRSDWRTFRVDRLTRPEVHAVSVHAARRARRRRGSVRAAPGSPRFRRATRSWWTSDPGHGGGTGRSAGGARSSRSTSGSCRLGWT